MYESPNVMDNMPNNSTKDEVFSIEDIKFGVNGSQKENLRTSKVTKMKY
jgi:hypothetical protein